MNAQIKLAAVVAVTVVMAALVLAHLDGINGPAYWRWPWRRIPGLPFFLLMALATAPFFIAQRLRSHTTTALLLLAATTFFMQLAAIVVETQPMSLDAMSGSVSHPYVTSYFTESVNRVQGGEPLRKWLSGYPEKLPGFYLHAKTKPPGIILFYELFLRCFGVTREATIAAGMTIALLAALAAPAAYAMLRVLTADRDAAMAGASFIALCPGLLLVVPQFDQVYPLITCTLAVLWGAALMRDRAIYAAAFGLVLSFGFFFAYHFVLLGVLLAGQAAVYLAQHPGRRSVARIAKHAAISIGVVIGAYLGLYLATGYPPIETFRSARATHAIMLQRIDAVGEGRHLPYTIPFDLTDFAMAGGWIGVLIAILGACRPGISTPVRQLAWLALAQIVTVALVGLLQGETFRVWLFMLPLLMLPIGIELRHWSAAQRNITYACLALIAAVICQNMVFNAWTQPVQ